MKKRNIIVIIFSLLLIFVLYILINVIRNNINKKEIDNKELLIEKQSLINDEIKNEINNKKYTIDNPYIKLNPYNISPLTALLYFESDIEEEVTIEIEGKDDLSIYTNTFDKTKYHYIPILGLYSNKENNIKIIIEEEVIKEIKITTPELNTDLNIQEKAKINKKNINNLINDLYFFTQSSDTYPVAYDINGDLRWYFNLKLMWKIDRLKNGNFLLSTERLINPPYYNTGLYEIDLLGKISKEYTIKDGYHHDYFEMENGNLLISSNNFGNNTVEDYIIEIDNKGNIVKEIDLTKIIDIEQGKNQSWIEYDWFHNNSIWYDKNTNSITLSGRHQDAVINIDYDTFELNWILGNKTNWDLKYHKYFFTPIENDFEWQYMQHAAMITPEGYVFLFDNGNNRSKIKEDYLDATNNYSRGVMYEINTNDMTIKQIFEYGKDRGKDFYSPYISDVDYLNNNHYIIHSGGISYKNGIISNEPAGINESDTLKSISVELLNNEEIFEIELDNNFYQIEKLSLYSNNNFNLNNSLKIGNFEETEKEKKISLLLNTKNYDKIKEKYEIELYKELDRIVFIGNFNKTDEVYLILNKGINNYYYRVRISTKPYTALCIDLDINNLRVTNYINDINLEGKFNIYISINNKIYNTGKEVNYVKKNI